MRFDAPLIDNLHALRAAILPERQPHFVLAARNEIDEELATGEGWNGVVFRASSSQAEAFRIKHGLDRPESLILIDASAVSTEAEINAIAVHELAHVANPKERQFDPPKMAAAEERRIVRELVASNDYRGAPLVTHDHALPFIRRALHLACRAVAAGYHVGLYNVCAGRDYGLSSAFAYLDALGDEPQRMADWKFARIEATVAPEEFTHLFNQDTQ